MAATSGNTTILMTLLQYHSQAPQLLNLNLQTIGGETPLLKAVMFCKAESLQQLLAAGANPNIPNAEGDTLFSLAEKMQS